MKPFIDDHHSEQKGDIEITKMCGIKEEKRRQRET